MNELKLDERARITADFEGAIERLRAGKPKHPDLKLRASQGKLRLNISNVSKEAGRSRTLIGHGECAYPEIRDKILGPSPSEAKIPRTSADTIEALRQTIIDLTAERDAALDQQHAMFLQLERSRRDARRAEQQLIRFRDRQVEGEKNVVPLYPPLS